MTQPTTRTPSRNASAALALRLAGAPYEDIATAVGYANAVEAREAVERALVLRADEADPKEKERLRALNAGRIERLLSAVWGRAVDRNDPEQLAAVRVAAGLIDRHTKLYGLDAPTEVTIHNPTATEIDQWVSMILGQQASAVAVEEDDVVVIEGEVVDDEHGEPAA